MTKSRGIRPPYRIWTDDQLAYLREHYADTPTAQIAAALDLPVKSIYAAAHRHGLAKSHMFLMTTSSGRLGRYGTVGAANRWKPGHQPWNKGVKGSAGHHPNTARNHYAPGSVHGRAAQLVLPLGALRISSDGNLERKTGTATGPSNLRWTAVHRLVWEAAQGPIPPGHLVVFKPGRKTTELEGITLDAIELLSRAENMRRNSVHSNYPPELARLVQLRGVLNRAIRTKTKETK